MVKMTLCKKDDYSIVNWFVKNDNTIKDDGTTKLKILK